MIRALMMGAVCVGLAFSGTAEASLVAEHLVRSDLWALPGMGDSFTFDGTLRSYETTLPLTALPGLSEDEQLYGLALDGAVNAVWTDSSHAVGSWQLYRVTVGDSPEIIETGLFEMTMAGPGGGEYFEFSAALTPDVGVYASTSFPGLVFDWAEAGLLGYSGLYDTAWGGAYAQITGLPAAPPVPEPATALIFGLGLVGMAGLRLFRQRN
jgi:PEP-CTERM motif-containing protein